MTLLPMLAAGSSYLCGCMGVCAGCAAVSRVLPAICVTREIACCTVVAERKAKLQARKQGCVSAGAGRCGTLLSRSKQDRAVCRGRPSPPPLAPPAVTPPTLVAPPPTHTRSAPSLAAGAAVHVAAVRARLELGGRGAVARVLARGAAHQPGRGGDGCESARWQAARRARESGRGPALQAGRRRARALTCASAPRCREAGQRRRRAGACRGQTCASPPDEGRGARCRGEGGVLPVASTQQHSTTCGASGAARTMAGPSGSRRGMVTVSVWRR